MNAVVANRKSRYVRTCPDLRLVFSFDSDSMFDMEDEPEDLEEALRRWIKREAWIQEPEALSGLVAINWTIASSKGGLYEWAPMWPGEAFPGGGYLEHFYWPIDEETGELIDLRTLPVEPHREWVVKATGWVPAPLTPFVHVNSLTGRRIVAFSPDWLEMTYGGRR